ncbi:hypothetical protein EMGR_000518, partial [Emarellia grisea]
RHSHHPPVRGECAGPADAEPAAPGLDRSCSFEGRDCRRDAGASHAQHQRQELVRQRQILTVGAVQGHRDPTRETLIDRELSVAQDGVGQLDREGLGIQQKAVLQRTAGLDRAIEGRDLDPKCPARDLNEGGVRLPIRAVEQGQTRLSLGADDACLRLHSALGL